MPSLKKAVLPVFCLFLAASPAMAQRSLSRIIFPTQRLMNRFGLERAWISQATLDASRDRVRHLVADEDVTFVQSKIGLVTAFDNHTGKRLWARLLGRSDHISFPAVTNTDTAFIVVGTTLFAVDKFSGEMIWKLKLKGHPSASPEADEHEVIVGMLDGAVYAYDIKKIQELYNESKLPQWSYQTLAWHFQAPDEMNMPPVSDGEIVNFASQNGSLFSFKVPKAKLVTGLSSESARAPGTEQRSQRPSLTFQLESDEPLSAPLAFIEGRIYMATKNRGVGRVSCIDTASGQTAWEFHSRFPILKKPYVIGNHIFVVADRGGIFCLSKATGRELWHHRRATDFLAATTSRVFASDDLGNISILDRNDGAPLGLMPLAGFDVRIGNDRTDRIILSTPTGLTVCIHEKGRTEPMFYKYPDRRPIDPLFSDEPKPPPLPGDLNVPASAGESDLPSFPGDSGQEGTAAEPSTK